MKQQSSKNSFHPPKALTPNQAELIKLINSKELTITTGPAGTGKSFLSAAYAAYFYHLRKVNKIILTRPTVPVSRSIGFLPGTLEEKLQPWTLPFTKVLEEFLSRGEIECMVKNGKLDIIPFETIRGHTFDNAFVVLDEAQNATKAEMIAFMTRLGKGSTVIVNGDLKQSDLVKEQSGLKYILDIMQKDEKLKEKVGTLEFTVDDIVRSDLCSLWVRAFDKYS